MISLKTGIALAMTVIISATFTSEASVESLPLEARQALTQWNFKFKSFKMSDFAPEIKETFVEAKLSHEPMKLEGDFNGDKQKDFVLLGEAEKQQYAVALVSDGAKFKAIELKTWSEPDFKKKKVPNTDGKSSGVISYLVKVAPGEIPGRTQKYDLIQIETYEGPTDLFEIKNSKAVILNKN